MTMEAFSKKYGKLAQEWADALLFGPKDQQIIFPFGPKFGLIGVGIIIQGTKEYLVMLVPARPSDNEVELGNTQLYDLSDEPQLQDLLKLVLPGERLDDARVLRVPAMVRQSLAGAGIVATLRGTTGPEVRWAGRRGFLTAGHVVDGATAVASLRGTSIGTVVTALNPAAAGTGATTPNADVGLVETTLPTTPFTVGPALSGATNVDLHLGVSTITPAQVVGRVAWLAPAAGGLYTDLYLTNGKCTSGGDSGTLATNSSSKAIGLVIGGSSGTFATYVQDIHTQLAALRGVAGLGSLTL